MAYCHGCGAVNTDDAVTCIACDRPLAAICPQCSSRNDPSASFCASCGRILNLNAPAESPAAPVSTPFSTGSATDTADRPGIVPGAKAMPQGKATADLPPRGPFLKAVLGGFAFAFLYLSQALSGYPLA
ncbi:MAG TPA: zinc ribbon domain-containing protein, partial [Candidatus Ozemobacteraceae bacterium]|nr:zinc ribbon domain-containing protein [Candidatus Ozemobacteraceae bacterium]